MTLTILSVLQKIATDLHETDENFNSGQWTQAEMIQYIYRAENDFLRDTGIVLDDRLVSVASYAVSLDPVLFNAFLFDVNTFNGSYWGVTLNRPNGISDIERISFNGKRIRRQTAWDLERENEDWRNQAPGNPRCYHEDRIPVDQFEVDRMPLAGGTFRIFGRFYRDPYVLTSETLVVNDCWEPYIRWGALAWALGKEGDGQDIPRADLARKKYLTGVFLAKRIVEGDRGMMQ